MYCTKCGSEIKTGMKFCACCGTEITLKNLDDMNHNNRISRDIRSIVRLWPVPILIGAIVLFVYYLYVSNSNSKIYSINDEGYVVFGHYEQDGDLSNGPEPIEWEILETNNNGTLLVSRYVLDCRPFDEDMEINAEWYNSSLRKWLNNDFINAAFSDEEKEYIPQATIHNRPNRYWDRGWNEDTHDKVFLLSTEEIVNNYNFNTYDEGYRFGYSQELLVMATPYAQTVGPRGISSYEITQSEYNEYLKDKGYTQRCVGMIGTKWWLRTPGGEPDTACVVYVDGYSGEYDHYHDNETDNVGVRPAIYLPM